jgi:hypothetical protein
MWNYRYYVTLTHESGMSETVGYDTRKEAVIKKRDFEILADDATPVKWGVIVKVSTIRRGF